MSSKPDHKKAEVGNQEDAEAAVDEDLVPPAFPELAGDSMGVFAAERKWLEKQLGLYDKPTPLKNPLWLFFVIVFQISAHLFIGLLYYWLYNVHFPISQAMSEEERSHVPAEDNGTTLFPMGGNFSTPNFERWTRESSDHTMMFAFVFSYLLPQTIVVPLMLEEYPISRRLANIVLLFITPCLLIAGNVAFLPYGQSEPTIHGMLGLTANIIAAIYIGRRYLVLIGSLISRQHCCFKMLRSILTSDSLKEKLLIILICLTTVVVQIGFQSFICTSSEHNFKVSVVSELPEDYLENVESSDRTIFQILFLVFIFLTSSLYLCVKGEHYVKCHTGNISKADFQKYFLKYESFFPEEDLDRDPWEMLMQPIRRA